MITIVLLNSSINLLGSEHNTSTGEVKQSNDSILIAYDDLRLANSKLIELEYEKEVNSKLKEVIHNDSIALSRYNLVNERIKKSYKKEVIKKNITIGVASLFFVTTIVALLVK